MHSLDVIILKNARAAGREAAHAHNTGNATPDQAIMLAADDVVTGCEDAQAEERTRWLSRTPGSSLLAAKVESAFTAGWNAGKQEG